MELCCHRLPVQSFRRRRSSLAPRGSATRCPPASSPRLLDSGYPAPPSAFSDRYGAHQKLWHHAGSSAPESYPATSTHHRRYPRAPSRTPSPPSPPLLQPPPHTTPPSTPPPPPPSTPLTPSH